MISDADCPITARRLCLGAVGLCAFLVACSETPAATATAPAYLDSFNLETPDRQWTLPKPLTEISGLAVTPDGQVFAHDDERGVIHRLDISTGQRLGAFALTGNAERGDYEGIAWLQERLWLVDSDGVLIDVRPGADGTRVAGTRHETGLGEHCEVEGLAADAARQLLVLSCKQQRDKRHNGAVTVHFWSADGGLDVLPPLTLAESALAGVIATSHYNPSAVELTPDREHLLLLAGRQQALAEVALDGTVLRVVRLNRRTHPQPEGIAITPSGDLLIADEGKKAGGMLAVYGRHE
ncbi:MAG: hypothetical protein R3E84_11100 [Pseudomonadales bacterium]